MRRSPRESSDPPPDCGIQVPRRPHASLKAAVASVVGPVNVLLAGVVQSVWNFQTASWFAAAPRATSGLGAPAGGGNALLGGAGRRPPENTPGLEHRWGAGRPGNILGPA